MTRAEAGRIGEAAAARWMEEQGFTLLERNWRCREGELDLIAMESGVLVIAEVRSLREGSRFGRPWSRSMSESSCRCARSPASICRTTAGMGVPFGSMPPQ